MTAVLTVAEVRAQVSAIGDAYANSGNSERAHGEVDALHRDVLRLIAGGAQDPAALACAALETSGIAARRWSG
jgi:hypothetical protein